MVYDFSNVKTPNYHDVSQKDTMEILIRLHLKEQIDLGLHCLTRCVSLGIVRIDMVM